jgi:hypothetical protein
MGPSVPEVTSHAGGAGRTVGGMSKVPATRRHGSALSTIDNGILVVGVVVIALVLLKLVGFVVGTMWFLLKLAALVGAVYVIGGLLLRRRRD